MNIKYQFSKLAHFCVLIFLTQNAYAAAKSIRSHMSPEVDPCNDFHRYVCGNFSENAIIRQGFDKNSSITMLEDKVSQQLKQSIENEISEKDPQTLRKLKSFYDTCTKEEVISGSSETEFLTLIKDLGGWPVLNSESKIYKQFDWIDVTYKLRKKGYFVDFFISLYIVPDFKNNSRRRILITQPNNFELIDQEYLLNESETKVKSAYLKYMIDFAKAFEANHDQAQKELTDVFNLKVKLAKIGSSPSEQQDMKNQYFPMNISHLQQKYPYVNWLEYLNEYLSPYQTIHPDDVVIISGPKYFQNLQHLLAETKPRVLVNSVFWWLAEKSTTSLDKRVRQTQEDFVAVLKGSNSEELPRWQNCINLANQYLPLAVGALYVRKHFDKAKKDSVMRIVVDIKNTFQRMLNRTDWMDDKTRLAALEKLNHTLSLVAYPDEFLDDQKLDNYHESLSFDNDSFFEARRKLEFFNVVSFIKTLNEPCVKSDWRDIYGQAADVDAYYHHWLNAMIFPSAFLQAPFFDTQNPKFMNYAGIGNVVAHEIIHGYDVIGSQFDKDGHLLDWWEPETKAEFKNRVKCIIDRYSNYTVGDEKLNGEKSQGENVADNGGLKIAYEAWKNSSPEELVLPGFESYTPEKMFWISYAHKLCTKYRPEYLRNMVITDTHVPYQFRIYGSVSNMEEFAMDFDCPGGSAMNPDTKCHVW